MTRYSLDRHRVYRDGLPVSEEMRSWYAAADWAVEQKLATWRYELPGLKYAHCEQGVEIVNVKDQDATGLEDLL